MQPLTWKKKNKEAHCTGKPSLKYHPNKTREPKIGRDVPRICTLKKIKPFLNSLRHKEQTLHRAVQQAKRRTKHHFP
jgi:hypothetical protein